ncbi:MAG: hypothetical protein Q9214_001453 [Letrouitia sp. 1 TL-2023]
MISELLNSPRQSKSHTSVSIPTVDSQLLRISTQGLNSGRYVNGPQLEAFGANSTQTGAIILYLIDQYDHECKISRDDFPAKFECIQWLMFQVSGKFHPKGIIRRTPVDKRSGQGPYFGQLAWFARFHKPLIPSAIERYTKEMERIFGVLDKALEQKEWLVGGKCTYADLSFVTWSHLAKGLMAELGKSDVMEGFPHYTAWVEALESRKPVRDCLDEIIAARTAHGLPP